MIVLIAVAADEGLSELAHGLGELGQVVVFAPQSPPGLTRGPALIEADMLSATAVQDAWRVAEGRHGPADLMVSVPPPAATASVAFSDVSDALWSSSMDSLTIAMHGARAAARAMTSRGRGRIILATWRLDDRAGRVPLAAVSGSICQLARSLAAEVGESGVTVNAISVAPGRLGDLAPVAHFLCSPESGYLTAEVLRLAAAPATWEPAP